MCSVALTPGWAPAPAPRRATPKSRAAHFAWRVLVIAGTTGCGARTGVEEREAGRAADAATVRDAGTDSAIARDAGRRDAGRDAGDDAGDVDAGDTAIYGAPPPDRPEQPVRAVPAPDPARVARARRRRRRRRR